MALHFFDFLKPKNGTTASREIDCRALCESLQELQLRLLSFHICKNMVAAAMGRVEIRTYAGGEEMRGDEYYLWNVSPNTNENSTMFMHKLIDRLFTANEALIIETSPRGGLGSLVVADSFQTGRPYPNRQNEYTGVTVGDFQYDKTFRENSVMHLKLNHVNIKPVLDGITDSYCRAQTEAMNAFEWAKGRRLKVHVDQLPAGAEDFEQRFSEMLRQQIKPFFEESGTVLPEFDGYKYEIMNMGTENASSDEVRKLAEDIFNFTASAFLIPIVLTNGKVEATGDANSRFLTYVIDPICDQLEEECNRKRYGLEEFKKGNYLRFDSSGIIHFDLFGNAASIEKLIGSAVFTVNDVRRAAGQAPINAPWADQSFLTKNIADVTESAAAIDA